MSSPSRRRKVTRSEFDRLCSRSPRHARLIDEAAESIPLFEVDEPAPAPVPARARRTR